MAGDVTDDIRYALRMIRKRPAFAAVSVTALALGIGANSAVFSIVNALLLRPHTFPELDRLVAVHTFDARSVMKAAPVAPADYLDWKERSTSFSQLSAYIHRSYSLTNLHGEPEVLRAAVVTTDFLRTLRVRPALGRDFLPGEDQPGHDQVVILSDPLWRNRFSADPGVVGRTVLLDSKPYLVTGVMPKGFEFPLPGIMLWFPLHLDANARKERRAAHLQTAGRLRDGVTLAQARAEMSAQALRLAKEYPETNGNRSTNVLLLRESQGEYSKPFLTLLQATALFVLLIACANLANLQLTQAIARKREIAVRAALGAGRWRVIRLLLVESIVIAVVGGVLGVGLAYWGIGLLKASVSPSTTRSIMGWSQVALHPPVLIFTLVIAIASGIVFGLSAALQAMRVDLVPSLKDGAQQGGARSRLRSALVLAEVMLAVIAVIGASQMVRGFRAMSDVYQGFSPDRIFTATLSLTPSYDGLQKKVAFYDRTLAAMSNLPGVEAVTLSSNLPGALIFNPTGELDIEGDRALSPAQAPLVDLQIIAPNYFSTLKIPVRDGRVINEQDGETTQLVAVVGQRLAERYWPGQSAIGKRVRFHGVSPDGWRTIVGVVGDVHQFWFEKDPRPLLYLPYRQAQVRRVYLAATMRQDPLAAAPAIRQKIRELDPALPLGEPRVMRELMLETLSAMRLTAGMMMVFGILALVLAAVGVYGVMAYAVTQRHREFGIRMALGALPRTVLRMVMWQGFVLAAAGCALGVAAGFGVSRAMSSLFFGISGNSLLVLAGVPALLAIVSLAACWVPARAVIAVDPVKALRHD